MPNHVKNVVKAEGIHNLPIFTKDEESEVMCFDFNKVIPMPESLDIEAGSIEIPAIEAVMRKLGKDRLFGKDHRTMSDEEFKKKSHGKTEEELAELGLKYITNKILYGADTWYDWCIANWGTKWNAYCNERPDEDTITFETAWSMPEPVMVKLSEMFPEIEFEHWYADEDAGSNTGYFTYKAGEITGGCAYDSCSNEAYEAYIYCWGESECLEKDEDGNWHHKRCENCNGC